MSNKTFNPKNRTKKGISPVIATVILVAVAVVIAASLAGFSSSLFGTYSSAGGAVTVKSMVVEADGDTSVTLINKGNVSDEIVSIQALPNAPVTAFTVVAPNTTTIPAGGETIVSADLGTFTAGQTITVKMTMESGNVLTQSIVVTA
jgi:flagellin-like protein